MMINKRLIREMEETKKYIGMQVLLQWAALLCNICLIFYISYALWQVTRGKCETVVASSFRGRCFWNCDRDTVCAAETGGIVFPPNFKMSMEKETPPSHL